MSYELAEKAAGIALQGVAKGAPAAAAFARVRDAVLPSLPKPVADVVAELDIEADINELCEQLTHVLAEDPPDAQINGLCFGLVEMVFGGEDGSPPDPKQHPEHTLYICGSARFDPEDADWPCDPEWWPETRYFIVPSFKALSDLGATLDPDASWLVACALIEPLSILLVGEACRRVDRATLLGGASWRGIGSGFDGGNLRDVGVVTRDGFASPALVESTPAPARRPPKAKKAAKTKAKSSKAGSAKAKRPRGKTSKAKGSTPKKASGKKGAGKKAAKKKAAKKEAGVKKAGKKKASRKVNSKGPASRKPRSKKASRKTSKKKGARRRGR